MNKENIVQFFSRLEKTNPNPETELQYANAFTLLVAVVLSAQATDAGVNKATKTLFKVTDNPQKMLDLGLDRLKEYVKTIGLFNNKAKNIIALSQLLVDKHHSKVPNNREELEALPGVGRKTANVVLNVYFEQPTIAVDTHIFRVSNRTGLATGNTPLAVELKLEKCIPKKYIHNAHHWLVLHGRYICKARKPLCPECPVNDLCAYPNKTV